MNSKNIWVVTLWMTSFLVYSCGKVTFNMTGASIGTAKTCQVNYFENRSDLLNPQLSYQITEDLKDKIQSNTSLNIVNNNADVLFEGTITGYTITPQSVTADGTAANDRLTITVKVKFTNEINPENSYDKSFSRFYEYSSSIERSSIENTAVEAILEELMDDIFNEAFSSW